MNTKQIKLYLLKYYRFERGYDLVCTEGIHNSDVCILNDKKLIEIEIKISKSDFKNDFKQRTKLRKHFLYENALGVGSKYKIPNYFYYCVPTELECFALLYLKDKNPNYGLIVINENGILAFKKIAKKIHNEPPSERAKIVLIKRLSSEMINAKMRIEELETQIKSLK